MSYQVIARKWRPQTFEEVTGQEHITRTLRGAIEHERLHHAYLFSGARGVGKTTTARLLAKAVNCHKSDRPTPTPCSFTDPTACPSCREIAEGRSIDVLEIDAASNTGVDNVRDAIINTVGVRPARDRYKVFIIDEVHMLSGAAFNALLKTLEEPPPRVLFIMATTESHKVPDTILSRCQQFEFRTIATAKIAERLRIIADAEKVEVTNDALREIARAGEGSMRDAQSAFDQVISFSEGKIEVKDVETALGIAGGELLARVMRAVSAEAPAEVLAVVEDLSARGHDLRNFCRDLLAHVRDLLVFKAAGADRALSDGGTDAERRALTEEAAAFSESDLVRFFHSLTETEKNLREGAHPRYQLEIGLVKLIEMRRLAALGQIVERLNALEEALRAGRAPAAGGGTAPAAPATGTGGALPRRGGASGSSASPAAPLDLSDARAPESPAPRESGQASPAYTGLKLVHTDAARGVHPATPPAAQNNAATPAAHTNAPPTPARAHAQDDAPFPSEGAVRVAPSLSSPSSASSSSATPYPPYFEPPPGPPLFEERAQASAAATAAAPAASSSPSSFASDDSDPLAGIKRALEARRKPLLVIALEEARVARIGDDELFVAFTPDRKHLRDTLAKPDNVRVLQEACREALGRAVGVSIVVREAGAEADAVPRTREDEERREKKELREWAESQPAVQELLRAFRGEIVEVRRVDGER